MKGKENSSKEPKNDILSVFKVVSDTILAK